MIECKRCGSKKVFTEEKGSQTGIYCSECGKWIKWGTKEEIRLIHHTSSSNLSDKEKLGRIENILDDEYNCKVERIREVLDR